MSPTARSLAILRRAGFIAATVEKWLPHAGVRQDLWGFADVLAVHPRDGVILLVQATTVAHVAARLAKARRRPELRAWLRAGGARSSFTAGRSAPAAGPCGRSRCAARTWRPRC